MGWHRLRWQWDAVSTTKRSCDAMRSDELRKNSTFKRHGIRLTRQEPVAPKHGRLAGHLYAQPLLCSTSYKRFKFRLPPPACPGTTCISILSLWNYWWLYDAIYTHLIISYSIHWWFHLCDYPIQLRYFLHIFHGMLKNAHVHQYEETWFSFLIMLSHIHIIPYHPQVLSLGLPNREAPRFKNMMIDANSRVTMVDFGLAVQVAPGQELHDSCGTVPFAAPEARLMSTEIWTIVYWCY